MTETRVDVKFSDVGRLNATWTAKIRLHDDGMIDGEEMYESVRKSGALNSRGIDFTADGLIIVGGFRAVGKWEIVP